VEKSTGSCATNRCGAAATSASTCASSAAEQSGPKTVPRPPYPATGLSTSSGRRSRTSAHWAGSASTHVGTDPSNGFSPR
jgi:hypothetical protein